MTIPKYQLSIVLLLLVIAPLPAKSGVVVSPLFGYMIPNGNTTLHIGDDWAYTSAGSSAAGLDFGFARLPFELRIMLTYINTGNIAENSNRYHDYSGNHWGVGLQKVVPLGVGGIEFSAGYLYRSENFQYESESINVTEFSWEQSGFLGGVRFLAPYSDAVDMTVLAKLELTPSINETRPTETGEEAILSRSGTVFIFAVGINWSIGE